MLLEHHLDLAKQLLIVLSLSEHSEHSSAADADNATAVTSSSSSVDGGSGCIHACLTSGAIASGKLMDIVQRLELESLLEAPHPVSCPLLEPLFAKLQQQVKSNNNHHDNNHSQQPTAIPTDEKEYERHCWWWRQSQRSLAWKAWM